MGLRRITIHNKKNYFVLYTFVFGMVMLIVYGVFIVRGKTLVGANDSLVQHYPFLIKVKEFYENILTGKGIHLVDFNNYMGLDNISMLNYYGLGNPLYLLTIGCPEKYMPYMYSFLALIKLYLGGIAFSVLCFQYRKTYFPTLIGTIIYILNPFVISAMEQLSFLDVTYQFPLLVIGFNQILKGKKSKTFVVAVMISALSGYYFLYMMTIMLLVYGIIAIVKRNSLIKDMFSDGIKTVVPALTQYLIGIMLASPVFLPAIIGFLKSYRGTNTQYNLTLLYDKEYYIQELQYLLFYNSKTFLTLHIVFVLLIIFLFSHKNKKTYNMHKWVTVGVIFATQIPVFGYIMNGFSYSSNRWVFGMYLLFAYIGVELLEAKWKAVSEKDKVVMITGILFLGMLQPFYFNSQYSKACLSANEIKQITENSFSDEIEEKSRLDGDEGWVDNSSLYHNVSKAQIYASVIPRIIMEAGMEADLAGIENTSIINGIDGRAELEALFHIKYFLTKDENKNIPYGFVKVYSEEDKMLYKNENELCFGYTYDTYVTKEDLEGKNGVDVSWNAMKNVVISEKDEGKISIQKGEYSEETVKGKINNITTEEGKIIVNFDEIRDSEVYVKIPNKRKKPLKGKIVADGKIKNIDFVGAQSVWYIEQEYKMYNLGYFENLSSFEIDCEDDLEKIEIYYHSMDTYIQNIATRNQNHLENVVFSANRMEGMIDVPENRLLYIGIPNISGWKAYVDGKETEIIQVNGMFMGVMLTKGTHEVVLKYFTPGLREGIVLFVMAIIFLVSLMCMSKRKCYQMI